GLALPNKGAIVGAGLALPNKGAIVGAGLALPNKGAIVGAGLALPNKGAIVGAGLGPAQAQEGRSKQRPYVAGYRLCGSPVKFPLGKFNRMNQR
ncbi:MAG: hypothetical protein D4R73_06505, partial [Deltaproteobacteria bacterium]